VRISRSKCVRAHLLRYVASRIMWRPAGSNHWNQRGNGPVRHITTGTKAHVRTSSASGHPANVASICLHRCRWRCSRAQRLAATSMTDDPIASPVVMSIRSAIPKALARSAVRSCEASPGWHNGSGIVLGLLQTDPSDAERRSPDTGTEFRTWSDLLLKGEGPTSIEDSVM